MTRPASFPFPFPSPETAAPVLPRAAPPMPARRPAGLVARTVIESPVGPLHAAATSLGVALLWFDDPRLADVPADDTMPHLATLRRQLDRYWSDPAAPFSIVLDLQGTPFQRRVWHALTRIPSGATRSYREIAVEVGTPAAVRAVGSANRVNPVAIVVPCHRVIGRDGTLTGYAGGLPRKAALLAHESSQAALPGVAAPATRAAA
jgi:methylated-DNA-[protein]-cysteine S-methyltransferase